jgi:nucleoside-diphosphate-sugar epimerase
MNILLLGGAGFIGSNLAERLAAAGHDITVYDWREDRSNLRGIRGVIRDVRGDIRDRSGLEELVGRGRFYGVVHLAAVSRVVTGQRDPGLCVSVNVDGTREVLRVLTRAGRPPWLVFGSSREVYGEPSHLPVRESDAPRPINVYGMTKLEGERLVREAAAGARLRTVTLRFSNVYGNERDILDRVLPKFTMNVLGGGGVEIHGGGQFFDFTHVDDAVDGIVLACELLGARRGSGGFHDVFHVLPGVPTTLQAVVRLLGRMAGRDVPVTYGEPRTYDVERFFGDPRKAREGLGFRAKIDPEGGIARTFERFREM